MKTKQTIVISTVASAALVAISTLSGGVAANASAPKPQASSVSQSCWVEATTLQSLCVPTGQDLVAAVQDEDGVTINIPIGTSLSGRTITAGDLRVAQLSTASTSNSIATSMLYDDINYGGGSIVMTSNTGCDAGIPSLVPYGWNDRASSFKSLNGCLTALYQNINYGGTHVGYSSSKASFASQNDAGSSWKTE